jgi:hypothetical protein
MQQFKRGLRVRHMVGALGIARRQEYLSVDHNYLMFKEFNIQNVPYYRVPFPRDYQIVPIGIFLAFRKTRPV